MSTVSDHTSSRIILLIPLLLSQAYLGFTLLVFAFGPIEWPLQHNPVKFWLLLGSYHTMFIAGYWWALRRQPFRHPGWSGFDLSDSLQRHFWILLALTTVALLIGHRNLTMGPSYIPTSLFTDFYQGLVNPLDGYLYKLSDEAKANFSGNTFATALFGLLIVCKILLITLLVSKWPELSWQKRVAGLTVTMMPLVSGVSVGTNKPIFDLLFLYASVLLLNLLLSLRSGPWHYLMERKMVVAVVLALTMFSPFYFQHTMSQRAPSLDYVESLSSTTSNIQLNANYKEMCESGNSYVYRTCLFVTMASTYMTQGYYGMSLAIDEPFESTYGIGHSTFLLDSFKKYLGIDLLSRTFQYKVSDQWSASGQWHSMYSQWANDLGFWGVGIGMFGLGFISAVIWISAITFNNFVARCMVPLFVVLFLFIPANNQIFNMLETLSTFLILLALWIIGFLRHSVGAPRTVPPA